MGESPREKLRSDLIEVPGLGSTLVDRVLETLNPSSLAEFRQQIENDRLRSVDGFGADRIASVRETLTRKTNDSSGSLEPSSSEYRRIRSINHLLEDVRCPVCLKDPLTVKRTSLHCGECGARFPVRRGIVDFVGNQEGTGGFAQGVMELPLYARWYEFFRPTLTRLITPRSLREEYALSTRLMNLQPDSRLLDVGCGTGNFTRHFARNLRGRKSDRGSVVTGLDLSWPMLTEARERSFREDLEDRIQYVRGNALNLPFRNNRFDRLHCAGSLHLMDSIQNVLGEFRRVLQTESTLVVGTFLLGDGTLRPLLKQLGGWLTQFHWFGENELKERLRGQGFHVEEFSVAGDAVTLKATLRV